MPPDHHHAVKKAKKELRESAKQAAAVRKNNRAPPPPGSQVIDLEDPNAIVNSKVEPAAEKPTIKEEARDDEAAKVRCFLLFHNSILISIQILGDSAPGPSVPLLATGTAATGIVAKPAVTSVIGGSTLAHSQVDDDDPLWVHMFIFLSCGSLFW